jgi:branched-chain amino acid transport system substrate-binding protein
MTDQKSIWLDIRRAKPDWILMWGWGAMNPTAIKEASLIRYPMDHFIGNWWSAAEVDVRGSGVPAVGYIGANFHDVGAGAPIFQEIREQLYAKGQGTGPERRSARCSTTAASPMPPTSSRPCRPR